MKRLTCIWAVLPLMDTRSWLPAVASGFSPQRWSPTFASSPFYRLRQKNGWLIAMDIRPAPTSRRNDVHSPFTRPAGAFPLLPLYRRDALPGADLRVGATRRIRSTTRSQKKTPPAADRVRCEWLSCSTARCNPSGSGFFCAFKRRRRCCSMACAPLALPPKRPSTVSGIRKRFAQRSIRCSPIPTSTWCWRWALWARSMSPGAKSSRKRCSRRWAVDPVFSGLPRDKSGKRSGKKNFSYLVYSSSFLEDLQTFKRLTRAKTQHVLVDRLMKKWMPALSTLSAKAKKIGVTLSLVPVDDQAKAALSAIPKDAKAIYLMPLPRLDDRERVALLSGLRARRLPTFSATGRAEVERGALATQQRGVDMLRAARRTAINIERVVRGEDPKTFSIHLTRRRKLLLNMTVARAIGWAPDWRVLVYAEKVGGKPLARGRKLGLDRGDPRGAVAQLGRARRAAKGCRCRQHRRCKAAPTRPSCRAGRLCSFSGHTTLRKEPSPRATNGSQPWHQGKLAATLRAVSCSSSRSWPIVTIQKALRRGQKASLRQRAPRRGAQRGGPGVSRRAARPKPTSRSSATTPALTDANLERAQVRKPRRCRRPHRRLPLAEPARLGPQQHRAHADAARQSATAGSTS
jgi:hypothetical protein